MLLGAVSPHGRARTVGFRPHQASQPQGQKVDGAPGAGQGTELQFGEDENVLETDGDSGCTTL